MNLSIGRGLFGLLGPNGAGKTTLMRILATLLRPSSGSATVGGYRTDHPQEKWMIRAALGYLPQDLGLYGDLSAEEFLVFAAALKQVPTERRREHIDEVLTLTGLRDVSQRRLKTFSGGMKRRVGVAQALLGDPAVLIVDEPTVGLDPQERVRFRTLLTGLAQHRTVILSTHIIEDVAQTCTQLAVLFRGRALFSGTVQELTEVAQGVAWEFAAQQYVPPPDAVVVASVPHAAATTYRLLAAQQPHPAAIPVAPTLEDGYLWRIQQASAQK
ncbi:MAG TPA: ATP-binding cassette domain-containing protein [Roseiflexaceae bacterium]|nr:ATP-binding cassette domain-containing protein [Roseiflexaceae bacterium]